MKALLALSLLGVMSAHAATITVNAAGDEFGTGAACTLREAIQATNINANFGGCVASGIYGNDTIIVGGIDITLTRTDTVYEDNNASGDLDINGNLTLDGLGAGATIIRADASAPNSERDRVMHVIGGGVTIRDMTLRDGYTRNQVAGGGLRTEPSTATTLTSVVVGLNEADGNAGGILNRGEMILSGSAVTSNVTRNAHNGGGGVFVSPNASLSLVNSRVLSNEARCEDDGDNEFCGGGGIYVAADGVLVAVNTAVESNIVSHSVLQNESLAGGGILSPFGTGVVDLERSTLHNNFVDGGDVIVNGGGMYSRGVEVSIRQSLISNNSVDSSNACNSGGVTLAGGALIDSVVSGNQACVTGGVNFEVAGGKVINSSIVANSGGGVTLVGNAQLINSSVIGNTGGSGVRVFGSAAKLHSSTIAANVNPSGVGGLFVNTGESLAVQNSVIAGNNGSGTVEDCSGVLAVSGNNTLLQDGTGCTLVGAALVNVVAGLAPLANNGGPSVGSANATTSAVMQTRAPLGNSPLLDAGSATGCTSPDGNPLTTDQRGRPRSVDGPDPDAVARCDIGAVEFENLFLADGFE